jgi:hypothetical protein
MLFFKSCTKYSEKERDDRIMEKNEEETKKARTPEGNSGFFVQLISG